MHFTERNKTILKSIRDLINMMKKTISAIIVTLAALTGQAHAVVEVPAVTPTGLQTFKNGVPWNMGFTFVANSPLVVTALGAFDAGHDGFQDPHSVGLWDATGHLLASIAIVSGDKLIGDFRYATISSVKLSVGNTYYVGASNFGDGDAYALPSAVTAAEGLTFGKSAATVGRALLFPSNTAGWRYGYFGGNLLVEAVPEPETYAMLLAGLGLMGVVARRRSASKQA